MKITLNTLEKLLQTRINPNVALFWLCISLENKDHDGFFHLDQPDWAIKFNCDPRQIRNYLTTLFKLRLIEKDYRTLNTGSRLFVKPLEPENEEDMTFFATFEESKALSARERSSNLITLRDLYNLNGTIRYRTAFLDNWDIKCEMPTNLERGDCVCFKAKFVKCEKTALFKNIRLFQLIEDYYKHAI